MVISVGSWLAKGKEHAHHRSTHCARHNTQFESQSKSSQGKLEMKLHSTCGPAPSPTLSRSNKAGLLPSTRCPPNCCSDGWMGWDGGLGRACWAVNCSFLCLRLLLPARIAGDCYSGACLLLLFGVESYTVQSLTDQLLFLFLPFHADWDAAFQPTHPGRGRHCANCPFMRTLHLVDSTSTSTACPPAPDTTPTNTFFAPISWRPRRDCTRRPVTCPDGYVSCFDGGGGCWLTAATTLSCLLVVCPHGSVLHAWPQRGTRLAPSKTSTSTHSRTNLTATLALGSASARDLPLACCERRLTLRLCPPARKPTLRRRRRRLLTALVTTSPICVAWSSPRLSHACMLAVREVWPCITRSHASLPRPMTALLCQPHAMPCHAMPCPNLTSSRNITIASTSAAF